MLLVTARIRVAIAVMRISQDELRELVKMDSNRL